MNAIPNLLSTPAAGTLPADVVTAITSGFTGLSGTVSQILLISIPAAVGIIGLTVGARYALKQIKGLLNKAS